MDSWLVTRIRTHFYLHPLQPRDFWHLIKHSYPLDMPLKLAVSSRHGSSSFKLRYFDSSFVSLPLPFVCWCCCGSGRGEAVVLGDSVMPCEAGRGRA